MKVTIINTGKGPRAVPLSGGAFQTVRPGEEATVTVDSLAVLQGFRLVKSEELAPKKSLQNDGSDSKVSDKWTKAELCEYLTKHGVAHEASSLKDELLDLAKAKEYLLANPSA